MSSIRFRLFFIYTALISIVIGFGYLSFDSYQKYSSNIEQLYSSYYLTDLFRELPKKRFDKEVFAELQARRQQMQEPGRIKAMSDFIQSYSDRNYYLMIKRARFFEKNEQNFRAYIQPHIAFYKKQVNYYGLITLSGMLFCILLAWFYTERSMFRRIKDLNKKMIDFLNQKYTYQFSVPESNEIGNLHGTFNSLAQKVLTNMDELKELDRAKSDFLSIASHELRTPLTSIKGSLNLINTGVTGELKPTTKNLVTIAETETDRLIRLINDILDLTKIEARRFPLNKSWVSVDELVHSTFESLQGLCNAARVKLAYNENKNLWVNVDGDRIQQVLTNLLSNAIKYSPATGTVFVEVDIDSNEKIKVSVRDEGEGIAPEDQDLIFEQFRQATGPKNPLVKGTGLGLAIAKALIEEHGGSISVHSVPKLGSTFYFTLPEWKLEKRQLMDQAA